MTANTRPSGGLEGHASIVTGGGTGIGKACAAALAADGAAVTICGRTESKLAEAADAISAVAGHGGQVRYVVADVTDEASVQTVIEAALEATGSLNSVVANAGGGGGMGPYHLQQADEFTRVLHLNVLGTLFTLKHAVPHLVKAAGEGGGSFVGMSSIAGHVTHPYFGAYTVSKAGIEEMLRNAADEYGPTRVRFNGIRPGFISTEIMEGIPRDSAVYNSYLENTPMADVGEPADIANLARFLVGAESRWITGQMINVDGGHALRRGPDFSSFLVGALGEDVMLARQAIGG